MEIGVYDEQINSGHSALEKVIGNDFVEGKENRRELRQWRESRIKGRRRQSEDNDDNDNN